MRRCSGAYKRRWTSQLWRAMLPGYCPRRWQWWPDPGAPAHTNAGRRTRTRDYTATVTWAAAGTTAGNAAA